MDITHSLGRTKVNLPSDGLTSNVQWHPILGRLPTYVQIGAPQPAHDRDETLKKMHCQRHGTTADFR
jgi:hypothetical protein